MPLTIGSLFAGIGGLELGLERGIGNGAHTVWQVEQNAYCRAVLAKHWPHATRYEDVCHVGRSNLAPVDVLCGGFPCQDISASGPKVGLAGARSGLWSEYARIIGELRPSYVVVENVADLLVRGIDRVLGDLAGIGYDAEWSVVSACSVGAPHPRERLFILAYPGGIGQPGPRWAEYAGHSAAYSHREASELVDAFRWAGEPPLPGMAYGVPHRLERLTALGNAVVPQVAEVVGRLIAEREARQAVAA